MCFASTVGSQIMCSNNIISFCLSQIQENAGTEAYCRVIVQSVQCAEKKMCLFTTPFILLSDACDCVTLDVCEELFVFIEDHVHLWTKPLFFKVGKNQMLRMCNDLLRRLSSSQNTVFCGRVQLFLAQLFPLSEKSALNLMSHFNLENVTVYADIPEVQKDSGAEKMEVDLDSSSAFTDGIVDYHLYSQLWSLQDFFRNPPQCYSAKQWKQFMTALGDILTAFSSYKLDGDSGRKRRRKKSEDGMECRSRQEAGRKQSSSKYFAKFLTSIKLMNLQLSDNHFRRYILIQVLILFQYLTSSIKFKTPSQVLTAEQEEALEESKESVYQLLREIPPDGASFAKYIEHVLSREENWIKWKNEGCTSLVRRAVTEEGEEEEDVVPLKAKRKPRIGELVMANTKCKKMDLGNPELTDLWNKYPDNLAMCQSESRKFLPPLAPFLEDATLQADPKEQVEEAYKLVKDPNFTFRALRLLSYQSPHFFQSNASQQVKAVTEFLEGVIVQTSKDLKPIPNNKST